MPSFPTGTPLESCPPGAGKSICYQIPALLFGGITIVVSPLISLMKDQVAQLNRVGVYAAYLNSSLTQGQYFKALEYAKPGNTRLSMWQPERLLTDSFLSFARTAPIDFVAVDEAHCVSQWGQDFRPSYLKIVDFVRQLPWTSDPQCFHRNRHRSGQKRHCKNSGTEESKHCHHWL